MNSIQACALSKSYTDESISGVSGVLAGKNCTISSVEHVEDITIVTFEWVADNGDTKRTQIRVKDGTPIYSYEVGKTYEYGDIIIYDNQWYFCLAEYTAQPVLDPSKFERIGSADGNYDIVQSSSELPIGLSSSDRKVYFSITDGSFWLWDGSDWSEISGGSIVSITQIKSTGEKIATITVDGVATDLYASVGGGGGAVDSVNGLTGDVVLTAEDVGALRDDTPLFSGDYDDLTNKPDLFSGDYNDLSNKPELFSGDYEDLSNKPSIPTALSDLTSDATHRVVTDTEKTAWNGKSTVSVTQVKSSGEKIATISVNNVATDIYASDGSGASVPTGGTTGQALIKHSNEDGDVEWGTIDGTPSGGTRGQLLAKHSSTNGDVEWVDAPVSVPSGGTTGQALVKHSNTDGDVEWTDIDGTPSGGTTGQLLAKHSNISGDVEWVNPPSSIPDGGVTGQVLAKHSELNKDVEWIDAPVSIPAGGKTGQALVKNSNADGDVKWATGGGGSVVSVTQIKPSGEKIAVITVDGVSTDIYASEGGGGGGGGFPLGDVSGVNASVNKEVASLTWTDPNDVTIEGVIYARWAGTKVVRKADSAPTDIGDGTLVADVKTRNQYSSTPLTDPEAEYGSVWYYRFFPYSSAGMVTDSLSVSVTPAKEVVSLPSQSGSLTYDGTAQNPTWSGYDSTKLTIGGTTSGTNAGTYTATFTPKHDYEWSDGTSTAKSVTWTINKLSISIPTVSGSYTFDTTQKSATISTVDPNYVLTTGDISAKNADTYTVYFDLIDTSNTEWSDASVSQKSGTWSITKALLTVPTVTGSYTYDTTQKAATISTYDNNLIVVSGDTSATNSGTYTVYFDLVDSVNSSWSDDSITQKSGTWGIAKAAGNVVLSDDDVILDADHLTVTVTLTNATGTVSVSSSSPSDVSATLSENSILLTALTTDINVVNVTVNIAGNSNYEPDTKIIRVTVDFIGELDDTSWDDIDKVSRGGIASTQWSIGDCKKIVLNGTVGTVELTNFETYVYIIGFDHNSELEGNGISFGAFRSDPDAANGYDIALIDSNYNTQKANGTKYFNYNHWGSGSGTTTSFSYGGWKGSDIRYDILGSTNLPPSGYGSYNQSGRVGYDAPNDTATNPVVNTLMAALPSDLRNVMKPITKYTDNVGDGTNTSSNVKASVDYLPLYTIYESRRNNQSDNINSAEFQYQKQYDYYANGNTVTKRKYSDVTSSCYIVTRSPDCKSTTQSIYTAVGGGVNPRSVKYSAGISPVFLV